MLTLVLGGARSGKSAFAEKIARKRGGSQVIYLATAEARDQEMADRIKKHRESRPATWQTVEEPYNLRNTFLSFSPEQVILLDCLTLFVSNCLLSEDNQNYDVLEEKIKQELKAVIKITRDRGLELIAVSNIVGTGLVPATETGRVFRDLAGRANQLVASKADEVYLCIAGLPVEIKEIGMKNLEKYSPREGDS